MLKLGGTMEPYPRFTKSQDAILRCAQSAQPAGPSTRMCEPNPLAKELPASWIPRSSRGMTDLTQVRGFFICLSWAGRWNRIQRFTKSQDAILRCAQSAQPAGPSTGLCEPNPLAKELPISWIPRSSRGMTAYKSMATQPRVGAPASSRFADVRDARQIQCCFAQFPARSIPRRYSY